MSFTHTASQALAIRLLSLCRKSFLVGNVLVQTLDFIELLLVIPGAGLHACKLLLHIAQLILRPRQPVWGIGGVAVAVDIKMRQ